MFVQWMEEREIHGSLPDAARGDACRAGTRTSLEAYEDRGTTMTGVHPDRLDDQQLMKELESIHRTRHDTLLHGSAEALRTHNERMAQLEGEYLRRHPRRPVVSGRTREGARDRGPGPS